MSNYFWTIWFLCLKLKLNIIIPIFLLENVTMKHHSNLTDETKYKMNVQRLSFEFRINVWYKEGWLSDTEILCPRKKFLSWMYIQLD